MPSPFPGMDPYLEDADVFPNLHEKFIVYLEEFLQPRLPEPYYAKAGQRSWIETVHRDRYPDLSVVIEAAEERIGPVAPSGVLTAPSARQRPLTITVADVPGDEHRESFVEIYTKRQGTKRLVTAIEVLSPTNKTPGEESAAIYRQKQRELLQAEVNLVEIDLLRRGLHVTAVPRQELLARYGRFDYHVCVHQFQQRLDFEVYPFDLTEPMPTIAVPLLPDDAPVEVDLQAVFDRCYETGPYRREIDYSAHPPAPALSPERLAWVRNLLAAM